MKYICLCLKCSSRIISIKICMCDNMLPAILCRLLYCACVTLKVQNCGREWWECGSVIVEGPRISNHGSALPPFATAVLYFEGHTDSICTLWWQF